MFAAPEGSWSDAVRWFIKGEEMFNVFPAAVDSAKNGLFQVYIEQRKSSDLEF